jgi:hypothetical protein
VTPQMNYLFEIVVFPRDLQMGIGGAGQPDQTCLYTDAKISFGHDPSRCTNLTMTPSEIHVMLMGKQPDASHTKFYKSGKMGFSDKGFDKDRFLAVAMLTLYKTLRNKTPSRVVLLIAPSHDKWVVDEFDNVSVVAFKTLKSYPGSPSYRVQLAKLFGSAFKTVFYSSRLLQLEQEPEAWTSFGFSKEDPLPAWMKNSLF